MNTAPGASTWWDVLPEDIRTGWEGLTSGRQPSLFVFNISNKGKKVLWHYLQVVRHEDNLRLEGKFEGKQVESIALRGERAQIKKHEDNLHMEGAFEGRRSGGAVLAGERAQVVRHQDNLRVEGRFEGRQQQQVLNYIPTT